MTFNVFTSVNQATHILLASHVFRMFMQNGVIRTLIVLPSSYLPHMMSTYFYLVWIQYDAM